MAWYPGAERMELQPESDGQAAIIPTQFIVHSIAAPWTPRRIYEYWRDSTNLESHFGLGYDGSLGQFIGTQTRADANMRANLRPDGTGAISCESASNLQHTDPWTDAQVEALIQLGVWAHQHPAHRIPLRICRTWDDPGFGYHRLFPEWSAGGTACPGDARVRQFHDLVFPGIVARGLGTTSPAPVPAPTVPEDDMTPDQIAGAQLPVWGPDGKQMPGRTASLGDYLGGLDLAARRIEKALAVQSAATTAAIGALAAQLGQQHAAVDTAQVVAEVTAAVRDAVAEAVIHVDVAVGTTTPKGN